MERNIRVVIADGDKDFRTALAGALQAEDGIEVVGTAGDGLAALDEVRELAPDLLLIDGGATHAAVASRVLAQYGDILAHAVPAIGPCLGFDLRSPRHELDLWGHIARAVGLAPPRRNHLAVQGEGVSRHLCRVSRGSKFPLEIKRKELDRCRFLKNSKPGGLSPS